MKRLPLLAVILAVTACASNQGPQAKIAAPGFALDQTFGPAELGYPDAPIDVKYDMIIQNNSTVPMTLRRIRLHTVNPPGGAYTLVSREYTFNIEIPPGQQKTVALWAHAMGYGVSMRDREPVTVKGVVYFDTPQGYYNQIFSQEIQQ